MTADEQRAFKNVQTEEEAQKLVDLFWARRDPTPGTFANEFRDEFRQRVQFADQNFKEQGRRGSMSERGRVLVVLGFPKELANEAGQNVRQMGVSASGVMDPTGGRTMADRSTWNYSYEESIRFGLPKIEVVFIHDGTGGRARRDTHRNDFVGALPAAIKYYIKNPELTSAPDWATREIEFERMPVATADPAAAEAVEAPLPDAPQPGPAPSAAAPAARKAARPASIGRLTLVKDAWSVQPQSSGDPFARLTSVEEFTRDGELGWLVEQCTGSASKVLSSVEVKMKITGFIRGEKINFNAPAEELAPDSIKASPGCYLLRGSVPLMDMDPGNYTLLITIGGYNLTKEFRLIEQ
jgi:GWxTD domain-containing protein